MPPEIKPVADVLNKLLSKFENPTKIMSWDDFIATRAQIEILREIIAYRITVPPAPEP